MNRIHFCCANCIFSCKKPFTEWSQNVPCLEFCELFEPITEEDEQRAKRWTKFK